MDSFTHSIFGFFIASWFPKYFGALFLIYTIFLASLPDLDVLLSPLQKKTQSYYLLHRAGSHSLIIAIPVSAIFAVIWFHILQMPFFLVWFIGFLCYTTHLLLDLFTASKIPLFYPLTHLEYRMTADRAINVYLFFYSLGNFFLFVVILFLNPESITLQKLSLLLSIPYVGYFLIRFGYRVYFAISLEEGQSYIPGLIPFTYSLYKKEIVDHHLTFEHIFYSRQFPHHIPSYRIAYDLNSARYDYYQKAFQWSHQYRFFKKWNAIIPFIWSDTIHNQHHAVLSLGESFMGFRGYSCHVIFSSITGEIVSHGDTFDYKHEIPEEVLNASLIHP